MSARVRALAPPLAVVALLLYLGAEGSGYDVARWTPVAIAVVALLAVRLAVDPPDWAAMPRPVLVAAVLLAAFAVWSLLSLDWARDQGIAWEGSNRTLLYLAVFAVLALWPLSTRAAGLVLVCWVGGIAVMAIVELVVLSTRADPVSLFYDARLLHPGGYYNATAALWMMAFWPAVILAARRGVPWWLRGVLGGSAVVLADLALLSQSRGSVFALPITLVLALALVPGRVRTFWTLVVVGIAVAPTVPGVLDVATAIKDDAAVAATLHAAVRSIVLAGIAAALVLGLLALAETVRPPGPVVARRGHLAGGALATVIVAGVVVAGLVVAGNPATRVSDAWRSFKGGYTVESAGSRLGSGLGSSRYDFYRVGLDVVRAHPLRGIGADNFGAVYLVHGRSSETPRYPHSLELRTLISTGVIGALLLVGFLAAALAAARLAARGDALAAGVAGGAVLVAVSWVVHGSADWFWEIAGLGAPAFAALGLACALAPRAPATAEAVRRRGSRGAREAAFAVVALTALAAVVSLAYPYLAEREVRAAGVEFARRPGPALARLQRASALNPLSDRAPLVAGTAWLRLGEFARADSAFREALARHPDASYAWLERGVIASERGNRRAALGFLARARALAPRDRITRSATIAVRSGRILDAAAIERALSSAGKRVGAG